MKNVRLGGLVRHDRVPNVIKKFTLVKFYEDSLNKTISRDGHVLYYNYKQGHMKTYIIN